MAIPGDLYLSVDFGSSPTKDDGTRPYTGTNPQWNSASIWLDGGPNQTQTRVGTPTTIKVRVSNKGKSPVTAVRVDAYVMNPFVGISQPQQAMDGLVLSGFAGSIGPGSGAASGTDAHVVTCMFQDPAQGPIPWTPTDAQLNGTINGDGHLCLIANVFADGDGHQLVPVENFEVVSDQHQGQRNITLLPMTKLKSGDLEFLIMPAPFEGMDTRVAFEVVDPKVAIGAGERWLLLSHPDISECHGKDGLVLNLKGKKVPLFLSDTEPKAELYIDEIEQTGGGVLPPFPEPLRARVKVDMGEQKLGAMHVFDVVQRDPKEQVLGALRFVTVLTG
ncbi:hypothetical protein [Streptomyces sp. NPDC001978]|uniref:hypothetical protein n=1 Tax=Streptomyces sp. NPDC001978 TaxID=3364627 RepID=UPI0036ABFF38